MWNVHRKGTEQVSVECTLEQVKNRSSVLLQVRSQTGQCKMYLEKVQDSSSIWLQVRSLTGKCGMYSRTGPG